MKAADFDGPLSDLYWRHAHALCDIVRTDVDCRNEARAFAQAILLFTGTTPNLALVELCAGRRSAARKDLSK